jgi:hypothetical protein
VDECLSVIALSGSEADDLRIGRDAAGRAEDVSFAKENAKF